jgi:urease accessory protein
MVVIGTGLAPLLMLTDGRFPAGGHAHSGGLEAAVAAGRVRDVPDLEAFLTGRLATVGLVDAAFAAAACAGQDVGVLERELDGRIPAPAMRLASRRQGRALLRAARAVWPGPVLDTLGVPRPGPHLAVTLGVTAAAAGLDPSQAALASAYGTVTGPAGAAVRLLGHDPYAVYACLARLLPACEALAAEAAGHATARPDALPAAGAPLLDIAAEDHATWEVRLFAS